MLRRLYRVDHVYALLLTLGISLIMRRRLPAEVRRSAAQPYPNPIAGGLDISTSRSFRGIACSSIAASRWPSAWSPGASIERTKLGSYLRAANENAPLVRTFGINVPRMLMLTYGLGVGAGRLRAA